MNQAKRIETIIMEKDGPTIRQTPKFTGIVVPSTQATAENVHQSTFTPASDIDAALEVLREEIHFTATLTDGSEVEVRLPINNMQDLEADANAPLMHGTGAIQHIPALRRLYIQKKALHKFLGSLKGQAARQRLEPIFQHPELRLAFVKMLQQKINQLTQQENLLYHV